MKIQRLTKRNRIQLEKIFFSCILSGDRLTDWRYIKDTYKGITWRHFEDNKHRVLWRVLESFDLGTVYSRKEIILQEKYEELKASVREISKSEENKDEKDEYIRELVYAWELQYEMEIAEKSSAQAWLERELEKTNSFFCIGGKAYLHELYAVYPVLAAANLFANSLGFVRPEEQKRLCWNCGLSHGVPPHIKCELLNKMVDAYDGYGCEYWQESRKLKEKIIKAVNGEDE
ncbi:MAG: hypothetical protein LBU88_00265 [Treponema sp.]|jgi:hypothetical protein|nr:hypothetical protein [Treponema sp.]